MLLATALPAFAQGCPEDTLGDGATRINKDGQTIAYRTLPAKIPVGKPFAVEVIACIDGKPPTGIRMDAGMPMHGHGMNYTPEKKDMGPGHARFDGLVFHMPGKWMFTFDLYDGTERKRTMQAIRVRP